MADAQIDRTYETDRTLFTASGAGWRRTLFPIAALGRFELEFVGADLNGISTADGARWWAFYDASGFVPQLERFEPTNLARPGTVQVPVSVPRGHFRGLVGLYVDGPNWVGNTLEWVRIKGTLRERDDAFDAERFEPRPPGIFEGIVRVGLRLVSGR